MLKLALIWTMAVAVTGCVGSQTETAADRLRTPAAEHARALAGDDPAAMRETGVRLLALMQAAFDW